MLSEVSLYVATSEQTIASRRRTVVEWGRGLTVDEYLDRDLVGEGEEFGRDGKLITWVLAPRENPTTLDFFCSCETFKRNIVIARPPQSGKGPTLEQGFGYGIASVFVGAQHRGKGYGKHMMRLLHWVLAREEYLSSHIFPEAEWGPKPERVRSAGDGWVSVLWSDIGPRFYEECGMRIAGSIRDGWVVKDPFSTVWKMQDVNLPPGEIRDGTEEMAVITWLDEKQARDTWNQDAELMKQEVVERAKETGTTGIAFLPNEGVAEFQWFRLHYHFSRYVENPPGYCGVKIGEGAFVTWTCEYRPGSPRTLIVTRLRADERTISGLIERVLRYAKMLGMEEIEAWNLPQISKDVVTKFGGKSVERSEDHLSSMKWYGEEGVEVEWKWNERYVWC